MSNRAIMTGASNSSSNPSDLNQPIDLAQKSHSTRLSETVKSPASTLIHLETPIISLDNQSQGARNDNALGVSTAALASRSQAISVGGTALNLVSPSSGSIGQGSTLRSLSHSTPTTFTVTSSTSTSPSIHSGHIPKGPAVVANIAVSRSPGLTSLVRTTGQTIGSFSSSTVPRATQRVVPISTTGTSWLRGPSSSAVITSKISSTSISRTTISTPRVPNPASIGAYHSTALQKTSALRAHTPPRAEVLRVQTPKGVQIAHPVSHTPKYITSSGRGMMTGSLLSPGSTTQATCPTMFTPSSTLVSSLASSGTTITPHPPVRPHTPAIPVRITAATCGSSQVSSQSGATVNAISMPAACGAPTCGTYISNSSGDRQHIQESHQIPLKTPVVKNPLPSNHQTKALSGITTGGAQIISSSKFFTQPQQGGSTLTVAQISNVNHKPLQHSQRTGSAIGRVSATPIPLSKVVAQGPVSVASNPTNTIQASVSTITTRSPHNHAAISVSASLPSEVGGVVLHRAPHQGSNASTVGQGERVITTVSPYNFNAQPYYLEAHDQNSISVTPSLVPHHNIGSSHLIPTTVCGTNRISTTNIASNDAAGLQSNTISSTVKQNSSPRPSILRKRPDIEGAPLKAAKNLSGALSIPISSPPSPKRPDSRGNSAGSTAAISSGAHLDEECGGGFKNSAIVIRREASEEVLRGANTNVGRNCDGVVSNYLPPSCHYTLNIPNPRDGVSPRKKPRKQKLMGNELQEVVPAREREREQPVLKKIKKDPPLVMETNTDDKHRNSWPEHPSLTKAEAENEKSSYKTNSSPEFVSNNNNNNNNSNNTRPHMSLMRSCRQSWKARQNHFMRHADVRAKEEKKRTINEIANQKMVFQRVNGWKVVHVSGQVEDLVDLEGDVINRLKMLLCTIEKKNQVRRPYKDFEKDVNRLSELVKANLQRSKIIRDQMSDAKLQMSKIFDHKTNIVEIMTKYTNKRPIKRKEKM